MALREVLPCAQAAEAATALKGHEAAAGGGKPHMA